MNKVVLLKKKMTQRLEHCMRGRKVASDIRSENDVFSFCFNMSAIYMDTPQDMRLNKIFISLEYELIKENNHSLSLRKISGKTFLLQ